MIKILQSGHPLSQHMQSVLVMDRDLFGSRAKEEDVGVSIPITNCCSSISSIPHCLACDLYPTLGNPERDACSFFLHSNLSLVSNFSHFRHPQQRFPILFAIASQQL